MTGLTQSSFLKGINFTLGSFCFLCSSSYCCSKRALSSCRRFSSISSAALRFACSSASLLLFSSICWKMRIKFKFTFVRNPIFKISCPAPPVLLVVPALFCTCSECGAAVEDGRTLPQTQGNTEMSTESENFNCRDPFCHGLREKKWYLGADEEKENHLFLDSTFCFHWLCAFVSNHLETEMHLWTPKTHRSWNIALVSENVILKIKK